MESATANVALIISTGVVVCFTRDLKTEVIWLPLKGNRTLASLTCPYTCAEKRCDLSRPSTVPTTLTNRNLTRAELRGLFEPRGIYDILYVVAYFLSRAGHWTSDRQFFSGAPVSNGPEDPSILAGGAPGRHS